MFKESLMITDDFEGVIAQTDNITWKAGNITVYQSSLVVGRRRSFTENIEWYPVVAGNHTLSFQAGNYAAKNMNISVGFVSDNVIYPSIGCPSILTKGDSEPLTILLSEERHASDDSIQIHYVELETINGTGIYTLNNGTIELATWIHAGIDTVEDELIISYNISSIPPGFYNLSVTTTHETIYTWPHAVYIIDDEPTEYQFIQLTDTHIGKTYNLINEKDTLKQVFTFINEEVQTDFVIISGDLIDWWKMNRNYNVWEEFKDALTTCNTPVFTTPGNHERYEHGIRRLHIPYTDNSPYHRYINPLNDYAFTYGNINFILFDSGYDWSRWETSPEASGLTNTQHYLLQNELGTTIMNQIITMHHPAVNTKDDRGLFRVPDDHPSGNNECIAFNRKELITYCTNNNVTLVLTGHTHENHVLNSKGEEPTNPNERPLFIQTSSTTLNRIYKGGRLIEINNGTVLSYDLFSI
jgi:Icc-related predicted phosphoesterase